MGNTMPAILPGADPIVVVITAEGIDPLTFLVAANARLRWVRHLVSHEFGIIADHIVFIDDEGNELPPMNHRVSNLWYHGLEYQEFPLGWGYRFEAVIDE